MARGATGYGRFAVPVSLFSLYMIWGATFLAIRKAVVIIPPFFMGGMRFFIAGVVLYTILLLRGESHPSVRQWGAAGVVGVLLLGGNGLVSYAEQSVASGLAAVLMATVPLWAAVFAAVWRIRPTRWEIGGLLLGFAGVGLLTTGSGLHGHPLAAGLLILAAASWAFGSIWSQRLPMPAGLMASAAEMIVGGAVMMGIGVVTGEHFSRFPSAPALWAFLYLVVFGSLLGISAYNYLLQNVRPALATSYAYVNPMVAVLLGILFAGERFTPTEAVALFVVITSVVLVVMSRRGTASRTR